MTILLADDEASLREVVELYLTLEGHRVVTAADGLEALDRFLRDGADLVILDLMMPRLDGLETLRRLRATPSGSRAPVIVVSAAPHALRGIADGQRTWTMPKPIDFDALSALLRQLGAGTP